MEFDKKHVQFKHPATILISGPTGSGKTILLRNLIEHFNVTFTNLNKNFLNILWCYGQWQPLLNVSIPNVNIKYINELPKEDKIKGYDIIIIDDLMNEMSKQANFENLFIKKSHHLNITVIFLVQNLFYNAKNMRTISLNCKYMIIMKNPRDTQQIKYISRQVFGNKKYFIDAYSDATKEAYGYIRIDLTPDTPDILRVTTHLVPINKKYIPFIYVENT